jgi:hypothetical protein
MCLHEAANSGPIYSRSTARAFRRRNRRIVLLAASIGTAVRGQFKILLESFCMRVTNSESVASVDLVLDWTRGRLRSKIFGKMTR